MADQKDVNKVGSVLATGTVQVNERTVPARVVMDLSGPVIEFEGSNGAAQSIKLDSVLLEAMVRPRIINAWTVSDDRPSASIRAHGPFTVRETAVEVSKDRAEHGDGRVNSASYVVWRVDDGKLMGTMVTGALVVLDETAPTTAAAAAILRDLSPAQRGILERYFRGQ